MIVMLCPKTAFHLTLPLSSGSCIPSASSSVLFPEAAYVGVNQMSGLALSLFLSTVNRILKIIEICTFSAEGAM